MKKRISCALLALLVVMFTFAGCGNTGSSTSQKVTIRLSTWAGSDEAKQLQGIIDKLNANSKTYKIVQDSNPADYDTRLKTQLSGNSGPDIFWVSAQSASQLASNGAMLDMTDMLSKSSSPAAKTSDYFEASLQPFTVNSKIYGLPWIEQPIIVYYNKDMFDKAGISVPDANWNWDTFLQDANKLTVDQNGKHPGDSGFDKANIKQWGFTLNGWPPVQMFIWQNNGEVIAKDLSSSPIDTPEAIGGLKFYSDLINSPAVPSQQIIKDRGFDTMFKNGQVAMFMGGAADATETQVQFKCQVAQVPAGPTGTKATFGDVLGMGINPKTKNKDAAFQAFLDLTNAIQNWKVMPPRKSMATLDEMNKLHPERSAAMPAIINSMTFARQYNYFTNYPDWDNVFQTQVMDKLINAHGDPAALAKSVKPQLDATLKK